MLYRRRPRRCCRAPRPRFSVLGPRFSPLAPHTRTRTRTQVFDIISYAKGGSVLRMLQGYMGAGFLKGVHEYLLKFSYKNAVTEDLWESLNAHAPKVASSGSEQKQLTIGEVMDTWVKQVNYPLLSVQKVGK